MIRRDNYRWTPEHYHRLSKSGFFDDERVELLSGKIWRLGRQSPLHATMISQAGAILRNIFGDGFVFSTRMPAALSDISEPVPDFSVAAGVINDYADHHPGPTELLLTVEVSDSTLAKDRGMKMAAYAEAGIAEYWIVNLVSRQVEVYRRPLPSGEYADVTVYQPGQMIFPLHLPTKAVAVDDLLPPMTQL